MSGRSDVSCRTGPLPLCNVLGHEGSMQLEAHAAHLLALAPAASLVLVQEPCLEDRRLCLSRCCI